MLVVGDFLPLQLLLDSDQLSIQTVGVLLDGGLRELQVGDLVSLGGQLLLELLLLLKHLLDVVILGECEPTSLLYDLVQMCNFSSEILDNFAGLVFPLLGLLYKLPGFVNLALEDSDRV